MRDDIFVYSRYAFLGGFIIAILMGFVYFNVDFLIRIIVALIIAVVGIIAGFTQITKEHEIPFLVGIITLITIGTAGLQVIEVVKEAAAVQDVLPFFAAAPALSYLAVLLGPTATIVAFRIIFRSVTPQK